jgi:hypothetical protein
MGLKVQKLFFNLLSADLEIPCNFGVELNKKIITNLDYFKASQS